MPKIQWLDPKTSDPPEDGQEYLILVLNCSDEFPPANYRWEIYHIKYEELFKEGFLISIESSSALDFEWSDINGYLPLSDCVPDQTSEGEQGEPNEENTVAR